MELRVDVHKTFNEFQCRFSFDLETDTCGIFGPSGSGKSTLMNMLSGLISPDKGSICLNGRTLFDSKAGINLLPEDRRVGVVFQHAHLFPHMKVKKNLFYGMKRTRACDRRIAPDQLIHALKLKPLLNRRVSRLSGGERQRVALGRTILACPRLILLDEPLSGLDDTLKYEIIPHLQKVFEQFCIPILFISHSIQEMRMMTQKVMVIKNGKIENQLSSEALAKTCIGSDRQGYTNLIDLKKPKDLGQLMRYEWGPLSIMVVKSRNTSPGQFGLSSRDILLFKKNPVATSARNMLPCIVKSTYQTDWLVGVELDCCGNTLVVEIVPESVKQLNIIPGSQVVAVFKASAVQRLY